MSNIAGLQLGLRVLRGSRSVLEFCDPDSAGPFTYLTVSFGEASQQKPRQNTLFAEFHACHAHAANREVVTESAIERNFSKVLMRRILVANIS